MFPLNKSNEMIFHGSSSTTHQQNIIAQDLIIATRANNSADSSILAANNLGQVWPRTQLLATNLDSKTGDNKKKIMHREIEKQRRKEMASLHAGLRSLIPLEYIKGKRSMSDHMNCAADYIKDLKIAISELRIRRNELIKESNMRAKNSITRIGSSNEFAVSSCVAVHSCLVGVEIVLSSACIGSTGHGLPLSRVLQLLLRKGLVLLSCVTTKVSESWLSHTIHAEVTDETCINLSQLQQVLNETISSQK